MWQSNGYVSTINHNIITRVEEVATVNWDLPNPQGVTLTIWIVVSFIIYSLNNVRTFHV